ncbi:MAG: HPr family phosphocarrier protein [Candidatus Marinimicrobia bacterium]|nr:HPr family phosphocarrier protein [Candidatus Neomarinimicrobiota bacterium]
MAGDGAAKTLVREVKVRNKYGMHARPAALFVRTASRYQADIEVEKAGRRVSGKSIIGLLTMEAYQGIKLKLHARGADAPQALEALAALFADGFGEE